MFDPRFGIDAELLSQLQQYIKPSPLQEQYEMDPEITARNANSLVSSIAFREPQLDYNSIARAQPSSFAQTNQGVPNDRESASDILRTILGAPFGILKKGIMEPVQDFMGAPQAVHRQKADAYADQMERFLLGSNSLTPEQKIATGIATPEQLGGQFVQTQSGGGPTAMGRDTSTFTHEPRKVGVYQWLKNLSRDERAQRIGRIQAILKGVEFGNDQVLRRAQTYAIGAAGDSHAADALHKDYQTQLLYRYGDEKNVADIDQSRAAAESSRASASNSYAARDVNVARLGSINADAGRDERFFNEVRLPTGQEKLRQLQQLGPIIMQLRQGQATRAATGGNPAKIRLDTTKALFTALANARKPSGSKLGALFGATQGDEAEVYSAFDVPIDPETGEPDFDAWLASFGEDPTTSSTQAVGVDTGTTVTTPATTPQTYTPPPSTTHPKFSQAYALVRKKYPAMSEGEAQAKALELLRQVK